MHECFASGCADAGAYRVALATVPADATSGHEVFACPIEEHLGLAVADMSGRRHGLAVWVTREEP